MKCARILAVLSSLFALSLRADTVELKTGERIEGAFKQATSAGAVIEVGGQSITIPLEKVQAIYFGVAPGRTAAPSVAVASAQISIAGLDPEPKPPVERAKSATTPQQPKSTDSLESQIERINNEPFPATQPVSKYNLVTEQPKSEPVNTYDSSGFSSAAPQRQQPQKGNVYIIGNNKTAIDARKWLASTTRKNRGCLTLSQSRSEAQFILELAQSGDSLGRNRITGDLPSSAQFQRADTGDILWSANSNWGGGMLMLKLERWACHK